VTVSAGIATAPPEGIGRDELVRRADSALYWAKEYGKDQVRVYRPDVLEIAELKRLASGPDRAARFRAAASLARAVDARDAYTGSHSERVSELAARLATRIGIDQEQVELTRLAASLHDLGKLAIPEEILRKPGPLSETERLVLERHPQIGFRMLESLGVDPVADWVLHHHERWDGSGYPDGLPGEDIPLGARIIFVADAYDAMTSDRVYRDRLSDDEAIAELERCAGTQFDPSIVSALAEELGRGVDQRAVAIA
jgi:putative nucleotidyltransferase with HDIG domain